MPRVAVLDDYQGVALKMADWSVLPSEVQVEVFRDHLAGEDAVAARLKGFEIVMAMRERTPFQRSLLERLPRLKLLTTTGMGNAAIDMEAATDLGITVCGTEGRSSSTSELTWGLILALLRQIPLEDRAVREGRWQSTVGVRLKDRVVGILGLGHIGSEMATVAKAFGMKVLAWSPNLTEEQCTQLGATLVGKDELLSQSDIVTIHLILGDRSRGLIGARELALMKPTAYLVNTSRGPIVDEAALVQALQRGTIAGAALDVFDEEPLPPDHPLRRLENTVVTPHIGYVTDYTYDMFFPETAENIQAFLQGDPIRLINPEVRTRAPRR